KACRIIADVALDHDLGGSRDLKVHGLAAHQLRRLPPVSPHDVPLADPSRYGRSCQKRHDRIPADDACNRHRLLTRRPLHEMGAPVLAALDEEEWRSILLADHTAIDADIHHAGVRVSGYDARESVDVAPPFQIVPSGDGEFGLINGLAGNDDLFD